MKENKDKEQIILKAAQRVFLRKGMDGARMQEIADEAEINKSLLHYYYRSKEKLFTAVFKEILKDFLPNINEIIKKDISVLNKIFYFIDNYMNMLYANPSTPTFVLYEMHKNPESLIEIFKNIGLKIEVLKKHVQYEMKKGVIKTYPFDHLIVNIIALCVFPFAAQPMLNIVLFERKNDNFNQFLEERKTMVKLFIKSALEKESKEK